MSEAPIRRGQLIAPFGVGAMIIGKDGTSMICGGLDHWYKQSDGSMDDVDLEQYTIREWRLEKLLNVDHFRLPPDFRTQRGNEEAKNLFLNVPFLRFPQWHYCKRCGRMEKTGLTVRGRLKCSTCEVEKKPRHMVQVPFIAICKHGHIQDFPWKEWVHESSNPLCDKQLKLVSTGGASLSTMYVSCECGKKRSLAGITRVYSDGMTELSKRLDSDKEKLFLCQGKKPWLGTEEGEACSEYLHGSLRNASNVYFSHISSSIYIPVANDAETNELVSKLQQDPYIGMLKMTEALGLDKRAEKMKYFFQSDFSDYTVEQIKKAITVIEQGIESDENDDSLEEAVHPEMQIRMEEYRVLNNETESEDLRIKISPLDTYAADVQQFFSKIHLVHKLKETRVFTGFGRIKNDSESLLNSKQMLRRYLPENPEDNWLPAYIVYGEGIFMEINQEKLRTWESDERVIQRIAPLTEKFRINKGDITTRFVMLHTLAHLLINQLTFECGYSTSALRERLYISEEMSGILIYTAAGDSDGTMGGLVRMGRPENFNMVFRKAINNARWCSSDPVCTEAGSIGGQGPESCNLSACHSCALLPETACEELNRFLDRGVVIDERIGFFKQFFNSYSVLTF